MKDKRYRDLETKKELMDVALGRKAPDLLIFGANLFNAWTGETLENRSVFVSRDRIAHVGREKESENYPVADHTRILDARGQTLIPGFIDGHTHLAWLVRPEEYACRLLASGTTTLITETMEIYPVAGKEGVKEYIKILEKMDLRAYATLPAMASISRANLGLDLDDLEELLALDRVVGLGEAYWQTVFQNPDDFLPVFERILEAGKSLEGHSAGARDRKLSAYAALGITSCHEPINEDQVLERLRKGIHVQIREGSIRSDLSAMAAIAEQGVDLSNISLVSDGITPGDLLARGHMEAIVQKAIHHGFQPKDAVRMATLNPARHFGLDRDIGSIAPGRFADMVLIPDLGTIRPDTVIAGGRIISEKQPPGPAEKTVKFSKQAMSSIKILSPLSPEDFQVSAPGRGNGIETRVIEFTSDLVTKPAWADLKITRGKICPDPDRDILKAAAVDRAQVPGKSFTGFVKGFGLKKGALATSAAWDGSDIMVIGENEPDMALAVNRIITDKGGIVLAENNRIVKAIPLPIFGLLSELSMTEMAREIEELIREIRNLGCSFPDPLLSLSTLTGAAIPFLRICSEGLVNLKTGKREDLFPG
ncbi:adenine deaminase C-terminal domain-containing protein [Desulfospira joergensenii]|uniref:adenine deaminase C-terminal domain-containing protein n=1 Tax=Desulfospira joergensenii TaxID=53329 RepID=UPI0003B314D7|nr:adenine deaminase C-terminal domain-containing protein [Desulfospira joergensenii]